MNTIPLAVVNACAPLSVDALRNHLAELPLPGRTTELLGDARSAIGARLHALVEYLVEGEADPDHCEEAVRRLVGLGPGLTPTGDDLLVALVATTRRLNGAAASAVTPVGQGLSLATAVAAIPPGLTTSVAHHLLMSSAGGRFPEPLAAFVNALGDPFKRPDAVAVLARRLAAIGAHSGADWLAGVVALARALTVQESGIRSQESGAGELEASESRFLNPDSCMRRPCPVA